MQYALNYSGTLIPDGFRLKHFNSGWSLSQNEVTLDEKTDLLFAKGANMW